MHIMEFGAIGELVGGLAVVGSLIYVGLQIRQNTKMEGAAAHRAILEEVSRYHQDLPQLANLGEFIGGVAVLALQRAP